MNAGRAARPLAPSNLRGPIPIRPISTGDVSRPLARAYRRALRPRRGSRLRERESIPFTKNGMDVTTSAAPNCSMGRSNSSERCERRPMAILRVISRRLVLQHEASFVNTAVLRGAGRFVVVLFPSPKHADMEDHLAARCCGSSVAGSPERATIATALPPVCKIGRASGARRLAPRALQPHCAGVDGVEIGLIPTARRAISTARASTPFSIEMLMSIAAVGVVIIGAIEEAG